MENEFENTSLIESNQDENEIELHNDNDSVRSNESIQTDIKDDDQSERVDFIENADHKKTSCNKIHCKNLEAYNNLLI